MDKKKRIFERKFSKKKLKEGLFHGKLATSLADFKEKRITIKIFWKHQINHMLYCCWRNKFLKASRKDELGTVRVYDDKVLTV